MRPAGFWRRGAAWSLDVLPVLLAALALCWNQLRAAGTAAASAWAALADAAAQRMAGTLLAADAGDMAGVATLMATVRAAMHDAALRAAAGGLQSALFALCGPPLAVFVALCLAWCVGFERSRLRATPGKRALGLRVVAADGGIAGAGRVLLRFLAGSLSWLSLNIGHLMAAMPPAFAAMHDRISGTRVVLDASAPARMPAWATAWLVAVAAAALYATAWTSAVLAAGLQVALERALWG